MTDTATLQTRLDALRKARASGVLELQHGDTRTRYKSDTEMAAAEASLVQQISSASGTARTPRYIHQTSKGL